LFALHQIAPSQARPTVSIVSRRENRSSVQTPDRVDVLTFISHRLDSGRNKHAPQCNTTRPPHSGSMDRLCVSTARASSRLLGRFKLQKNRTRVCYAPFPMLVSFACWQGQYRMNGMSSQRRRKNLARSVTHPHGTQPLQVLSNSLYRVLCTIRSLYLCAIGLVSVLSLARDIPRFSSCNSKKLYSLVKRNAPENEGKHG